MLACLKLGLPYTNLDDQNPPHRLRNVLQTCRPRLILCDGSVSASAIQTCILEGIPVADTAFASLLDVSDSPEPSLPNDPVLGSDIAYLMFTSGSTGLPKGVAITHLQLINFIAWTRQEFDIRKGDILSNVNQMFFDNSVFDFYSSLFNGAALAPIERSLLKDPQRLVQTINEAGCTIWFSVPSLLIYLAATRVLTHHSWPSVRAIIFGGEGYPKPELRKLYEWFGNRSRLVNVYGPTECTCICSAHDIREQDLADSIGLPPIGHLAPNFRGLLLNGNEPATLGDTGELCLIGPNVGLGYYRDPARTDAAFVPNPFCDTHREYMYRTGDLMRVAPEDGLLHFSGRKDNQIKHMGYRIELEEIEFALARLPGVTQCAVLYSRVRSQFGSLLAYVTGDADQLDAHHITTQLRLILPEYMIPRRIEILSALPRTASGKIDRVTLAMNNQS